MADKYGIDFEGAERKLVDGANNREGFCDCLDRYRKTNDINDIENPTTEHFLEAMTAWLRDTNDQQGFLKDDTETGLTWGDLMRLIRASCIYE